MSRRILGRGFILQADRTSTETTYRGQRFELRALTLDVEIPGKAPYEVRVTPRIPRIVEALPGATLDLSIDPSDPNDVEILGPAGAVDWIRAAATVPGQTWSAGLPAIPTVGTTATPFMSGAAGSGAAQYAMPVARAARKGCGAVVMVIVVIVLAFAAAVVVLLRHVGKATHAPAPHATPEHRSRPAHPH